MYIKTCTICDKRFKTRYHNKNICSFQCKQLRVRQNGRESMKHKRNEYHANCPPCIICGFNLTTDIHHEGRTTHALCPNHHALITLGIKTLKEILEEKNLT